MGITKQYQGGWHTGRLLIPQENRRRNRNRPSLQAHCGTRSPKSYTFFRRKLNRSWIFMKSNGSAEQSEWSNFGARMDSGDNFGKRQEGGAGVFQQAVGW